MKKVKAIRVFPGHEAISVDAAAAAVVAAVNVQAIKITRVLAGVREHRSDTCNRGGGDL